MFTLFVLNATDKSTSMQTVQSEGFLWLNPIAMFVICSGAEVVQVWSREEIVG